MTKALTARQEAFCQGFAATGNAYASAVKAGCSKQYAYRYATKMLGRPAVKARIQELYEERAAASGLRDRRR